MGERLRLVAVMLLLLLLLLHPSSLAVGLPQVNIKY